MICDMYGNFGREITLLETLSNLNDKEIDKFDIWEKVVSDEDCEELIRIYKNRGATMNDYVNFIADRMKDVNVILSLKKIYSKLREKSSNIQEISKLFLNFELSSNLEASDNIFLLHLLRNCSLEKNE